MHVIQSVDRTNWAIILRYNTEATALLRAADEVGELAMRPPKGSPRDLITPGLSACEQLTFAEVYLPPQDVSTEDESLFPLKERLPLPGESELASGIAKEKDCTQEGYSFDKPESSFLYRVMRLMDERANRASRIHWPRKRREVMAAEHLDLILKMKRQVDAYGIVED